MPVLYRGIRAAVKRHKLVKVNDTECMLYDQTFKFETVKSKNVYWVAVVNIRRNLEAAAEKAGFWATEMGVTGNEYTDAISRCKTKYVDGQTRTIHYLALQKGLCTNDIKHHFAPDVFEACLFCSIEMDEAPRENWRHVLLECGRAREVWRTVDTWMRKSLGGE